MKWWTIFLGSVALVVVLIAADLLYHRSTYTPFGQVYTPPIQIPNFVLTDDQGKPYALESNRGQRIVLVYFGYTNCPNICPLVMADLRNLYHALSPEMQRKVKVLFITVDPQRDTPKALANYVPFFDRHFLGLTSSPSEIRKVARAFGVFYEKTDIVSPTNYQITHTADVYALNLQGRLALIYNDEQIKNIPRMEQDLRWLLSHPGA